MKFKLGIALGFAAGYWYAMTPPDQRREKLDEVVGHVRDNPRVQRVTETVTRDVRRLGDAVEQRFVEKTEGATKVVSGAVGSDESGGTGAANGTSRSRRS